MNAFIYPAPGRRGGVYPHALQKFFVARLVFDSPSGEE